MPPIHPVFVHYPIALTFTAVLADTVGRLADIPSLLTLGRWSLPLAAIGAVLAAIAGYVDMKRSALAHETHELIHLHKKSGIALAIALPVVSGWRVALDYPSIAYLIVGWVLVAAIAVQAWLGGEIVYAHGGGVAAAGQGTMSETEAKKPSRRFFNMVSKKNGPSGHH